MSVLILSYSTTIYRVDTIIFFCFYWLFLTSWGEKDTDFPDQTCEMDIIFLDFDTITAIRSYVAQAGNYGF